MVPICVIAPICQFFSTLNKHLFTMYYEMGVLTFFLLHVSILKRETYLNFYV